MGIITQTHLALGPPDSGQSNVLPTQGAAMLVSDKQRSGRGACVSVCGCGAGCNAFDGWERVGRYCAALLYKLYLDCARCALGSLCMDGIEAEVRSG
jgi:hypothetical protein